MRVHSFLHVSLIVAATVLSACSDDGGAQSSTASSGSGGAGGQGGASVGGGGTGGQTGELRSITELMAGVEKGATWASLPEDIRADLDKNGEAYLAGVRAAWGKEGLATKEAQLLMSPTDAMLKNFDLIVGFLVDPIVDATFQASQSITNAALLAELKKFYLVYCAQRRDFMGYTNPNFKDWDGSDLKEFVVHDPEALADQKAYAQAVQDAIKAIDNGSLSATEVAVAEQIQYYLRMLKRGSVGFYYGGDDFHKVATSGEHVYDMATSYENAALFPDLESFLQAANGHFVAALAAAKYANAGTVDTLEWALDSYLDPTFLAGNGLDPETTAPGEALLLLGTWYVERVKALPDAAKPCTVYTEAERRALWDGFTADNMSDNENATTMASYAAGYGAVAAQRLANAQGLAIEALEYVFPAGSPLLNDAQKADVVAAINAETKPAALLETMKTALTAATGAPDAAAALDTELGALTFIGGYDDPNTPVKQADIDAINEMFNNIKTFLATSYGGLVVDIASLLPNTVTVTTDDRTYAGADGSISVGLAFPVNKASLYATLLHEVKHSIDFNSHAAVQGAAWEGGATAVEKRVWPSFIEVYMANEGGRIALYKLGTEIDMVRITATTDATLKVFLRDSCEANEPNSTDFAKDIVAGYGMNPSTWLLRARRAHLGTQYLSYDYGLVQVLDTIDYLQAQIGPSKTVDPFLLQACNIPSPRKDDISVNALKACLGL